MLQKTPQVYFANVPAVLNDLKQIERQGDNAKTYDELKKLIGKAKAIKLMHDEVTAIRQESEWTILSLRYTLGERINDVPKSNKHQIITDDKLRRKDLPFKSATRARLLKLLNVKSKKHLRSICEGLWAVEKDATWSAILEESGLVDFQKERAKREASLATKIKAMPDKKYGVVLADPEWQWKSYSKRGTRRSPEKHYPTSDISEIKRRKIPAAKDCVLFLWATVPSLPKALEVMDAWGFNYVSNFVWDKEKIATGYWNRNQHEILLVGTRGKVVPPAPGTQWPSVIRERATQHSRKPEKSYALIEEYYPTVPKIELNARRPRDGWDNWGNEVE